MSLLELWRVLTCGTLVKVVRNYDHEVLYAGRSGDMPSRFFPMRVCYVDVLDCQDILYISVEELKGEDNAF